MGISCVILGAGGHTRVLLDVLLEQKNLTICGILDRDSTKWGSNLFGVPVLGGDELLITLHEQGVSHFVLGVGSAGNNKPREAVFHSAMASNLVPLSVQHRTAICSPRAKLGPGVQLLAGTVINPGAEVGANVIVNTGSIIEHDCQIGDHVHVATGARLAGSVKVGTGAHIGAGATIRQGITIGPWAVVGAGAVVVKDVLSEKVVAGVPARELHRTK